MKTNLSIKKYLDYRAFILENFKQAQKKNSRWTYGSFSKSLGLKDTSSLTKILRGTRNPGNEFIEKLIQYYSFTPDEAQHFKDLIQLQKVKKNPKIAAILLERMGKEHPYETLKDLDDQSFSLIANWYCFAIREMVKLDEFFEDPKWISSQLLFKVTPTEANRAIESLIRVGLLARNKEGVLMVSEGRFQTANDISSEAIKLYHESMLDNAKLALRKIDVKEREFTASTFSMHASRVPEAKEMIREMRQRFCKIFEETSGDCLYQVQVQFFPLTKKIINKKSEFKMSKEMMQ